MKISPYQQNAMMMREARLTENQRVIHQKHLQDMQRLNHQHEAKCKIPATNVWARPNAVDVFA